MACVDEVLGGFHAGIEAVTREHAHSGAAHRAHCAASTCKCASVPDKRLKPEY